MKHSDSSDCNLLPYICRSIHFSQVQDFPFQHTSALTSLLRLIELRNKAQLRTVKKSKVKSHSKGRRETRLFLLDDTGVVGKLDLKQQQAKRRCLVSILMWEGQQADWGILRGWGEFMTFKGASLVHSWPSKRRASSIGKAFTQQAAVQHQHNELSTETLCFHIVGTLALQHIKVRSCSVVKCIGKANQQEQQEKANGQ